MALDIYCSDMRITLMFTFLIGVEVELVFKLVVDAIVTLSVLVVPSIALNKLVELINVKVSIHICVGFEVDKLSSINIRVSNSHTSTVHFYDIEMFTF